MFEELAFIWRTLHSAFPLSSWGILKANRSSPAVNSTLRGNRKAYCRSHSLSWADGTWLQVGGFQFLWRSCRSLPGSGRREQGVLRALICPTGVPGLVSSRTKVLISDRGPGNGSVVKTCLEEHCTPSVITPSSLLRKSESHSNNNGLVNHGYYCNIH